MIPVYILTGFLGAGKTTLLKNLLTYVKQDGRRPAVLMNEFGMESVDSLALQGAQVPIVDMVEGCVCCTVRGSLATTMLQLIELARPDVIFLEATGVANPVDIVDALLEPDLQGVVELGGVFTLVGATRFPLAVPPEFTQTQMQRTMFDQVRYADVILLSKTDVADFGRKFAVESVVRELNAKAQLLTVTHGAVDVQQLLDVRTQYLPRSLSDVADTTDVAEKTPPRPKGLMRRVAERTAGEPVEQVAKVVPTTRTKTSFGSLQTIHYEFTRPVVAERMYQFLYSLPEGVLRAKGFYLDAENGQLHEFQYAPPTPLVTEWPEVEGVKAFAVVIGENLDEEQLVQQLTACEE
ncbi:CobW family GTP-binding protein [Tumebacillus permanentifrigoris]|uniref:G3E family GTPase n=1 Tax=Tumebacillus permanentifrigoris TaxID=378543 RepID=A0A316DG16_9BACL|nr:GTP-binding protein [Tumebacillus permanentifrigoris]PWK15513.1 G3E family GTPase [Tumebacillus permanentifrigoris]